MGHKWRLCSWMEVGCRRGWLGKEIVRACSEGTLLVNGLYIERRNGMEASNQINKDCTVDEERNEIPNKT